MSRLLCAAAAVMVVMTPSLVSSAVPQGFVDGLVNVQTRQPSLVSNEYGNTFFPGERLTITVSGPMDINWVPRSEESCFLFFCETRRWVDHNWHDATQWPVRFSLVDGANNVMREVETVSGRVEIEVPPAVNMNSFNRPHRLLGMVSDLPGQPAINPGRSSGQVKVRIDVASRSRAQRVPTYLAAIKPTAQILKQAWVADPFLIEQNRRPLSLALVELARSAFSETNTTTASLHRDLLDYAAEISPESSQVTTAIADMFLKQGKPDQAEAVLVKLIGDLRQKIVSASTPELQIQLATAYLRLAQTMEKGRGYASADDLAAIWAQYGSAYEIATRNGAQAIASEALMGRAHSQRGRNTMASLKAAEDDFRRARDLSPRAFYGAPIGSSQDGRHLVTLRGEPQLLVRWQSIDGTTPKKIVVDAGKVLLVPRAVSLDGKVLAQAGDVVGWIDLAAQKPEFESFGQFGTRLGGAQTNGRSSILFMVPEQGSGPGEVWLLKNNLQRSRLMISDAPAPIAEIASNSERYVVAGQPSGGSPIPPDRTVPTLPIELRRIGADADTVLRKVSVPVAFDARYKVSPDGRKFASLSTPVVAERGFGATLKLVVWDEASATVDVKSKDVPAPGFFPVPTYMSSPPDLPDDVLLHFEFSSDGQQIFAATGDGSVVRMNIQPDAPLQKLDLPTAARPKKPFLVHRMNRVGPNHLVIAGMDSDGPYLQFVDATVAQQSRLVRTNAAMGDANMVAGYWRDGDGTLGVVEPILAPLDLQAVRGADPAAQAPSGRWALDGSSPVTLLNGGRFACSAGATKVSLKNLADQSESTVAVPSVLPPEMAPPVVVPAFGFPMPQKLRGVCVPQVGEDRWLFVSALGSTIHEAVPYRGHQALTGSEAMPTLPKEFIEAERAAAARLKLPFFEPRFDVQELFLPPDPLFYDGFVVAIAIQNAVTTEAASKGAKWFSMAYVMLQQSPLTLRYARVPVGGVTIKILPPPINKLIYLQPSPRGGKLFWKPLTTDVPGVPIELPAAEAGQGESMQIIANPEGTRLMVMRQFYSSNPQQAPEIDHALFAVGANEIRPIPCGGCVRRPLESRSLRTDTFGGAFSSGSVDADRGLNYFATYTPDQALIHSVADNSVIASLPRKQVLWISADYALFLSGQMEFSQLMYKASGSGQ